MPRVARLDAPLMLHHVTGRGIERRSIFGSDDDRCDFVWYLAVYTWALMPDVGSDAISAQRLSDA